MRSGIFNITDNPNMDFYSDQLTPLFCRVVQSYTEAHYLRTNAVCFLEYIRRFPRFLDTWTPCMRQVPLLNFES
jgi:hypothetical protein